MPDILPDPLDPCANLVYFNESVETAKEEVLSAETTANKIETALVAGENDDSEEPLPRQRLPLFLGGFLQRHKTEEKKDNQKGSELVVAFPKSTSNSKSSSSSKPPSPEKPKKKTTLSGRTV
jgi:hypothetical protein